MSENIRRYFDIVGPNEFFKTVKFIKKYDIVILQPKYDGSNILKYNNSLYTRHLNPVPPQWIDIITTRFPEIIKSKYNFYFEFGGKKLAPAGYTGSWQDDYDYRVFDFYEYRYPLDELRNDNLRVVETIREFNDIIKALEEAIQLLRKPEFLNFEGIVVKMYGVEWNRKGRTSLNIFYAKVKHSNLEQWTLFLGNQEASNDYSMKIPTEEIRHHIYKLLIENFVSKGKDINTANVESIWNDLEKELAKHGYKLTVVHRETVRNILRDVKRTLRKQKLEENLI